MSGRAVCHCQGPRPTSVEAGEKIKLREETRAGVGPPHAQGRFCPICKSRDMKTSVSTTTTEPGFLMARRILFAIDDHRFFPGSILFFLGSLFWVGYTTSPPLRRDFGFVLVWCRPSYRISRKSRSPNSEDPRENFFLMTPGWVFLFLEGRGRQTTVLKIGGDFAYRDYFCFCFGNKTKKVVPRPPTRRARHATTRPASARLLAPALPGFTTPMATWIQDVNNKVVLPIFFVRKFSGAIAFPSHGCVFFRGSSIACAFPTSAVWAELGKFRRFGLAKEKTQTEKNGRPKKKQKRQGAKKSDGATKEMEMVGFVLSHPSKA